MQEQGKSLKDAGVDTAPPLQVEPGEPEKASGNAVPPPAADRPASARPPAIAAPSGARKNTPPRKMQQCKLEGSIWDAVLLVGIEGQELACSAWTIMCLLLNVLVQGFFSIIVITQLASRVYSEDTVDAYMGWRINTAHNFKNYDLVSGQSLSARVCNADPALELSTKQGQAFADIVKYLSVGHYLATLCCLVWVMSIVKVRLLCS